MKFISTIFFLLLCLSACGSIWVKPYEENLGVLPKDKATVIVYPDAVRSVSDPTGVNLFPVWANGIEVCRLVFGQSSRITLDPGEYKMHTKSPAIDRVSSFTFEAGKVYYVIVYEEKGMWVGSLRLRLTEKPKLI